MAPSWALDCFGLLLLHAGVLAATDVDSRARRMATLGSLVDIELLPIDDVRLLPRAASGDSR